MFYVPRTIIESFNSIRIFDPHNISLREILLLCISENIFINQEKHYTNGMVGYIVDPEKKDSFHVNPENEFICCNGQINGQTPHGQSRVQIL